MLILTSTQIFQFDLFLHLHYCGKSKLCKVTCIFPAIQFQLLPEVWSNFLGQFDLTIKVSILINMLLKDNYMEVGEYVFGSTDLALKSARIVDYCRKSSGFTDLENTVDRGSAVTFGTDSGLCLF